MARTKSKAVDKLDENVYDKNYLEPTKGLNEVERELWDTVVKSMKPGYFIESDRVLIGEYIKLKQISNIAYEQLHDYDDFSTIEGNRIIGVIAKTSGAMSTISQKLGIAPSSRVRHDKLTNQTEPKVSDLDSLLD